MGSLDERRDAQVELEHEYYEDSGLADEHAKEALKFHGRVLAAIAPGASRHQAILSGAEASTADMISKGRPQEHNFSQPHASSGPNVVALAVLSQSPFRNPNDAAVLEFCTSVTAEACDAPAVEPEAATGVRVCLSFKANPYFSNSTVSRTFGLGTSPSDDIEVVCADAGTEIKWAPGKNATVRVAKTPRSGGPRTVPVMSLFRLFTQDGLQPFGEMQAALLNTVKPLIKVSAFAVHAATGTRKLEDHQQEDAE
uniref:Uncharacterized protein n=1 Tax=Neobodo designis TaxID=312471 RepID=A0A7S1PY50_NEODS